VEIQIYENISKNGDTLLIYWVEDIVHLDQGITFMPPIITYVIIVIK
jgi:hypothetical protein